LWGEPSGLTSRFFGWFDYQSIQPQVPGILSIKRKVRSEILLEGDRI
jgi:hypothetical protein